MKTIAHDPNVKRIEVPAGTTIQIVTSEQPLATASSDELIAFDATCPVKEKRARDNLIATGSIKAVRIGRKLFVRRSDLLALVDKLPGVTRALHTVDKSDFVDDDEADIDARVLKLARAK